MRIADRTELANKPAPLTCSPDATVRDAVTQMAEFNYGSIFIVDPDRHILGVMTERDIFRRVIGEDRDPNTTIVAEVMTTQVRKARSNDKILDWLQVMSNERFRRLPIVDEENRLVSVMTQGDFVAYTWPQLLSQLSQMAQATLAPAFNPLVILGGIGLYTIVLVGLLLYAVQT